MGNGQADGRPNPQDGPGHSLLRQGKGSALGTGRSPELREGPHRLFTPKIEKQSVEFVQEFDETVGEFEIDAGYIHSALTNLLENAVDACAKDVSKNYHKIVFGVRQDPQNVIFDVFDNGVGMDAETVAKLFTPFFSSKGRRGTGLGLFISNKIVQQHGGEIQVKSTAGQGTLFTIKIPKNLPESLKNPSAAATQ